MIAQLEEEVNRNLAEMQITDHENMSSHKQRPVDDVSSRAMNTEFSQNVLPSFNYSHPLHDGGEKLTVFRELFPSSSSNFIENKVEMNSRELFANSSNTKITSTEKEQSSCKETIAEEKEYPLQSRPQIYRVTDSRPFCAFQEEQTNFKPESVLAQPVSSVAFSPFPSRDMYCNCRQDRVTQPPRSATATSLLLREKQTSGLFRTQAIQSKKSEVPCIAQRNELNEESMCGFSRPTVSHSSAFTRVHSSDSATSEELFSVAGSRTSKVNEGFEIVVPTPRRPVISNIRPNKVNLNNTIGSEFISRHRQIMLDALEKNRQYAQEILLDAEVSLYARNIEDLRNSELKHRLENPLAKLFNEGDDMVSVIFVGRI